MTVTITSDLEFCPVCEAGDQCVPLVKTTRNDRICNTCGFACVLVTEADELDAQADRQVRSRGANIERASKIGRFQSRW